MYMTQKQLIHCAGYTAVMSRRKNCHSDLSILNKNSLGHDINGCWNLMLLIKCKIKLLKRLSKERL